MSDNAKTREQYLEEQIDRLRAELGILSADSAELHRERDALRAEVSAKDKFVKEAVAACSDAGRLRAEVESLRALLDGMIDTPCPTPLQWKQIGDMARKVRDAARKP